MEMVTGRSCPFLPYSFRSLRGCQLAPILMKVFLCCEHLSTSIWPGPKSISQEIPNSCQMVLSLGEYQMNKKLPATGKEGPHFLLSLSGCAQSPSSYQLAQSLTPDQQVPYFCALGFARWSAHLGWMEPEWTCACLGANHQCGPCFSLITHFFLASHYTSGT